MVTGVEAAGQPHWTKCSNACKIQLLVVAHLTRKPKTLSTITYFMQYLMRDGTPCPYNVWSELLADPEYRELVSDLIHDGTRVETCWLGVDGRSFYLRHRPIDPHLIFYTMVTFPQNGRRKRPNVYLRYATENEALAGHRAAVRRYGLMQQNMSSSHASKTDRRFRDLDADAKV